MTFRYDPSTDTVIDTLSGRHLDRRTVRDSLGRWRLRHDELLRTPGTQPRLDAREIAKAMDDLRAAVPATWAASAIPILQPITLKVAKMNWPAVPEART